MVGRGGQMIRTAEYSKMCHFQGSDSYENAAYSYSGIGNGTQMSSHACTPRGAHRLTHVSICSVFYTFSFVM